MSTNTFTCFSQLPVEIRHMIWIQASNVPRNIDIRCSAYTLKEANDSSFFRDWIYSYHSPNEPPSVLSASRESRSLALKYYELLFGTKFCRGGLTIGSPARIYINVSVDRLFPTEYFPGDLDAVEIWSGEPAAVCLNTNRPEFLDWVANHLPHHQYSPIDIFLYNRAESTVPELAEFEDLAESKVDSVMWTQFTYWKQEILETCENHRDNGYEPRIHFVAILEK